MLKRPKSLFTWIVSLCNRATLFLFVFFTLLVLVHKFVVNLPNCRISGPKSWITDGHRNFAIRTTWDGHCVKHEPIKVSLAPSPDGGCLITILGPFFNSPAAPAGPPGQPFPHLWDYEVVEAFFLNDKNQYLEVELSPHGQHLLLMLNGVRNMVKDKLPLTTFKASIKGDRWTGEAVIPRSYFPPGVTKFNAYAIHGEGSGRQYEALYPARGDFDEPDFHRLQFFQPLNMADIVHNYDPAEVSDLWKPYSAAAPVIG